MKGPNTNHAWHAVVENLQHLKLLHEHPADFLSNVLEDSPCYPLRNLPLSETWGTVLGPLSFFHTGHKKGNSFQHAKDLIKNIKQELGVTILWAYFHDETTKPIEVVFRSD